MITLRLAIPAVLAAAAVAGCFTYFVTPPTRVEADQRLPPTVPNLIGPDTMASTSTDRNPNCRRESSGGLPGSRRGDPKSPMRGRPPVPMSHQ